MDSKVKPHYKKDIKIFETDDGAVINDGEKIHTLNTSAYEIMLLCEGNLSIAEIVEELSFEYENDDLVLLVDNCIMSLIESGLVSIS